MRAEEIEDRTYQRHHLAKCPGVFSAFHLGVGVRRRPFFPVHYCHLDVSYGLSRLKVGFGTVLVETRTCGGLPIVKSLEWRWQGISAEGGNRERQDKESVRRRSRLSRQLCCSFKQRICLLSIREGGGDDKEYSLRVRPRSTNKRARCCQFGASERTRRR